MVEEQVDFATGLSTERELEGWPLFLVVVFVVSVALNRAEPVIIKLLGMVTDSAGWVAKRFDRPAAPAERPAPVRADLDTKLAQKNKVITSLTDENERLKAEAASNLTAIEELKAQIVSLSEGANLTGARAKVIERELLRDLVTYWPGSKILFVKEYFPDDDEFRMVGVSPGYADTFLDQPATVYHGKTDAEVWGAEVARNYQRGDRIAIENLQMIPVNEVVSRALNGVEGTYTGWKKGLVTPAGLLLILSVGEFHTPLASGHGLQVME